MGVTETISKSLARLRPNSGYQNKESGKLNLPGIVFGNAITGIKYDEALSKIKGLKSKLINTLNALTKDNRTGGQYFWLYSYILALCAQEKWICSVNDSLIASDIPWDLNFDMPSISSTIGDAVSYAERLKDPKDHFLKALLLSFSGWTLLSTEENQCACLGGELKPSWINVLVQTEFKINKDDKNKQHGGINFFIGVQSDNQAHLEHHYSFKEKSVRHSGLIIIHCSKGYRYQGKGYWWQFNYYDFKQASQFKSSKISEHLNRLVNSFI